jgi:hypothetical protein
MLPSYEFRSGKIVTDGADGGRTGHTWREGKSGMIKGEADDENERFEFTIEPYASGGFTLSIRSLIRDTQARNRKPALPVKIKN